MRVLMVLLLLSAIVSGGRAEIPRVISYQGKVTDASGNPVADAAYTMRFRIFDAASGGTLLWDSSNQNVPVSGGIFTVLLGSSPQPAIGLDFSADYWLLVTFSGVDQTPRQRLASVGYAYMASGLVPGTTVSGSITGEPWATLRVINTGTTNDVAGIWGQSACPGGGGVYGYGAATTGETYGVLGLSISTSGRGVYGYASATTGTNYGVYGYSPSSSGRGVYGAALATTGSTYGVYGANASSAGIGVYGQATATAGYTYGGYFQNASSDGRGIWVRSTATTGNTVGGRFEISSPVGSAVSAFSSASTGSAGGIIGWSMSTSGVGVDGSAMATTGLAIGVMGVSFSTGGHGVYYSGGLAGSGTKSCVVKTSQGPSLMYCQESPENWFEDVGRGQLLNGRAHIELDPLFLETVTIDAANPMNVFVQLRGDCRGVYVEEGLTGFDVIELQGGSSDVRFVYRVMAKRKGFEERRLDYCTAAERDSYLFPELRENVFLELERQRTRPE